MFERSRFSVSLIWTLPSAEDSPLQERIFLLTLGLSKSTVQRILVQTKLKPHRLERYLASDDADFEAKARGDIGPQLSVRVAILNCVAAYCLYAVLCRSRGE